MWCLAPLVLAQVITVEGGRPRECSETRAASANVWERAKSPELRRYCEIMSLAAARLAAASAGKDVLALLDEAERVVAGRTPTLVLRGRALLRTRRTKEAFDVLEKAVAADGQALSDPAALLAYARAAARSGAEAKARGAYLSLMPRADLLPTEERSRTYFEAGLHSMRSGAQGLPTAVLAFREMRRDATETWADLGKVALALALDRQGLREESASVLGTPRASDVVRALALVNVIESLENGASADETEALRAMVLERSDPAASRAAWKKFLEKQAANAPYRAHAESRIGTPVRRAP